MEAPRPLLGPYGGEFVQRRSVPRGPVAACCAGAARWAHGLFARRGDTDGVGDKVSSASRFARASPPAQATDGGEGAGHVAVEALPWPVVRRDARRVSMARSASRGAVLAFLFIEVIAFAFLHHQTYSRAHHRHDATSHNGGWRDRLECQPGTGTSGSGGPWLCISADLWCLAALANALYLYVLVRGSQPFLPMDGACVDVGLSVACAQAVDRGHPEHGAPPKNRRRRHNDLRSVSSSDSADVEVPEPEHAAVTVGGEGSVYDGGVRRDPPSVPAAVWCRYCRLVRPLRCKHCHACGRCVLLHDHHCPWIGVCVGGANRRAFTALTAAMVLAIGRGIGAIVLVMDFLDGLHWLLLLLAGLTFCLVLFSGAMQVVGITTDRTTHEMFRDTLYTRLQALAANQRSAPPPLALLLREVLQRWWAFLACGRIPKGTSPDGNGRASHRHWYAYGAREMQTLSETSL